MLCLGEAQDLYGQRRRIKAVHALEVRLLCVPASLLRGTCAVQNSGGTVRDDPGSQQNGETATSSSGVSRVTGRTSCRMHGGMDEVSWSEWSSFIVIGPF